MRLSVREALSQLAEWISAEMTEECFVILMTRSVYFEGLNSALVVVSSMIVEAPSLRHLGCKRSDAGEEKQAPCIYIYLGRVGPCRVDLRRLVLPLAVSCRVGGACVLSVSC